VPTGHRDCLAPLFGLSVLSSYPYCHGDKIPPGQPGNHSPRRTRMERAAATRVGGKQKRIVRLPDPLTTPVAALAGQALTNAWWPRFSLSAAGCCAHRYTGHDRRQRAQLSAQMAAGRRPMHNHLVIDRLSAGEAPIYRRIRFGYLLVYLFPPAHPADFLPRISPICFAWSLGAFAGYSSTADCSSVRLVLKCC